MTPGTPNWKAFVAILDARWLEIETTREVARELSDAVDASGARALARDARKAKADKEELRTVARDSWARENGVWRSTQSHRRLFRGSGFEQRCEWTGYRSVNLGLGLIDHEETWHRGGRLVAVTSHPYEPNVEGLPVVAALRAEGFLVVVHPQAERTSWYYPGSTALVEIWRPGTHVLR